MKTRIILALLVAGTSAHADDLSDRVRECKTIGEDTARLACYDGLVRAEVASPPPAPASLGAETMRQKDRTGEAAEKLEVSATVTRCSESADGRYVFYFSNGQVWKQSKNDRVHFGDCNFDVTITKDFFGYKMQQEGENRRIRIKRLK